MAALLYGAGLRLTECLELRVKNIDFGGRQIVVWSGKGGKDRATPLPESLIAPLTRQLALVARLHARDLRCGFGRVVLPDALAVKYPNAAVDYRWQFVFPAGRICKDPRFGPPTRYHVHESVIQKAVSGATRLARFVEQQPKIYLATATLGADTSTDDATGETLERGAPPGRAANPTRAEVEVALASFAGRQRQRPPAFSAKHVGGQRSYVLARRGEAVALAEVDIEVLTVELVGYAWPEVGFRATVSPGCYLRAIARDLGARLGTGGHCSALRREAIGGLRVEDAIPLAGVGPEALRPPLAALGHLPRLAVSAEEARALGYGQVVTRAGDSPAPPDGLVAVSCADRLIAVALAGGGVLQPQVVLEPAG